MVDTLVNLIVNIEEGWGNHFVYDVMPLKKKRPDLFPMVLAAFANHPRWFIDHLKEIEMILDCYDGEAYIGRS
jgi:hypothetical protein